MNRHVASAHEGIKPFKCEGCDYSCSRKCHLKQHVATVYEGKKPFTFVKIVFQIRVTLIDMFY